MNKSDREKGITVEWFVFVFILFVFVLSLETLEYSVCLWRLTYGKKDKRENI